MYYSDFIKSGTTFVERDESYLAHHGIKGQKWGVRRFQNPDGSLTKAGQKRYYDRIKNVAKEDFGYEGSFHRRNRAICGQIEQVDVDQLRENFGLKVMNKYSEFNNISDKIFEDIANNFSKYADKYADYINAESIGVDRKDKNLLLNMFDEDPDLGTSDLLNGIKYDPKEIEKFSIAEKAYHDAERTHLDECRKVTDRYLGKYARQPVTLYVNPRNPNKSNTTTAGALLTSALLNYTRLSK